MSLDGLQDFLAVHVCISFIALPMVVRITRQTIIGRETRLDFIVVEGPLFIYFSSALTFSVVLNVPGKHQAAMLTQISSVYVNETHLKTQLQQDNQYGK